MTQATDTRFATTAYLLGVRLGAEKAARDMPPFTKQDRPKKTKDIYTAVKREHPGMPAEKKARIAARQGKPAKQRVGPPYKGKLAKPKKSAS